MSTRPVVHALTAVEPLQRALGSRDERLLRAMLASFAALYPDAYPETLDEFGARAKDFVHGTLRDGAEPGEWHDPAYHAAKHLGLLPHDGPLNDDDWNLFAWCDYLDAAAGHLTEGQAKLLSHLCNGRPLVAKRMVTVGAYYAWLSGPECADLADALTAAEERDPDLLHAVDNFHAQLLDWLDTSRDGGLLLTAC